MSEKATRIIGLLLIMISGPMVLISFDPNFIMLHPYIQDILIMTGLILTPIGAWMLIAPIEEDYDESISEH